MRTADGRERDVSVLIYGTGFRATEFLAPIEIVERGGVRPHDRWREGATAYLGMAVPEFPNMFLLHGPTTNLGHNSVVNMVESQVRYIMRWLRAARDGRVEVAEEALAAYAAAAAPYRVGGRLYVLVPDRRRPGCQRLATAFVPLLHGHQEASRA